MFKAVRTFVLGEKTITAGEVLETATQRQIDLGLVVEVQETDENVSKEPKEPKETKKAKEQKKVEKTETVEEILTEQSSDVTVEKTETVEE